METSYDCDTYPDGLGASEVATSHMLGIDISIFMNSANTAWVFHIPQAFSRIPSDGAAYSREALAAELRALADWLDSEGALVVD